MSELPITIGGKKIRLNEAEKEFSVLTDNPSGIEKLKEKQNIKNISQPAPEVQLVTALSPKKREALMDEIRRTGISHHVYQIDDKKIPQQFIITDKVNIRFKKNISKKTCENFLKSFRVDIKIIIC